MNELHRLAELVRDERAGISSIWLPPDGRLQTVGCRLDDVCGEITRHLASVFRGRREDDFPMHYCAWGKARVGSTALNNLFGLTGFPSYYQPVKSMLRLAFAGSPIETCAWPTADQHPALFTKETQGPYTLGECLFIPMQVLIEAGYPASKLHLIVLDRDPERSLASWIGRLTALRSADLLAKHYMISALNVNRVRRYARQHGVPVTHYVYEASKEPVTAARALFSRLGLAEMFSDRVVTDWGDRGDLDAASAHQIVYPPQPAIYDLPGLHGSDTGYRFRNGTTQISDAHHELLERSGVNQAYRDSVAGCVADLELSPGTAERIFGRRWFAAPVPHEAPVSQEAKQTVRTRRPIREFEVSVA